MTPPVQTSLQEPVIETSQEELMPKNDEESVPEQNLTENNLPEQNLPEKNLPEKSVQDFQPNVILDQMDIREHGLKDYFDKNEINTQIKKIEKIVVNETDAQVQKMIILGSLDRKVLVCLVTISCKTNYR